MTLLTVMLAAAFTLISAEFRTTDASFGMRRAYITAQVGLAEYLVQNRALNGVAWYDSVRVTLTDGYADVVARKMMDSSAAGPALWLIRSQGTITTATLSGEPLAQRTVATLARQSIGGLPTLAGFVAANPVVLTGAGTNNPLRGIDGCGTADNKALVVARGDYTSGGAVAPLGGIDSLATRSAVLDSTHIDWNALLGGSFTPDYIAPSWPAWGSGYPVGLVNGDFTGSLPGGVGLLVVKGNLLITGGTWQGIILVGGWVRRPTGSTAQVNGMVVSGLNNLVTPNSVGPDSLDRSGPNLQWNSCSVTNAILGLATLTPLRNLWIDTWSSY